MSDKHSVMRRCIICRGRCNITALLRFVRKLDGQIIFDKLRRCGLRGAWICGNNNCLTKLVNKQPFERAFKKPVIVDIEYLKISVQ